MEKIQYNKDRPRQAFQLALLGLTDKQMAAVMDISTDTLNLWKRTRSRFLTMLTRGKMQADGQVAEALYKRAIGYSHKDVDIKVVDHQIIETPIIKYYPPDTQACKIWLALRQRANWSEIQRSEVVNTNINILKVDVSDFTEQELKMVEKFGLKQLTENAGTN